MKAPFDKRSIRIVTVLVGISVLAITLVHFAYPSLVNQLNLVQAIVTTTYLGYMGWYVGYDWGVESLNKSQERK